MLVQGGKVGHYVDAGRYWVRVRGDGPVRVPTGTQFTAMVDATEAERWEYTMRVAQAVGNGI